MVLLRLLLFVFLILLLLLFLLLSLLFVVVVVVVVPVVDMVLVVADFAVFVFVILSFAVGAHIDALVPMCSLDVVLRAAVADSVIIAAILVGLCAWMIY